MTDTELLELLAAMKQKDLAKPYQSILDHPQGLTFPRGHQLVLSTGREEAVLLGFPLPNALAAAAKHGEPFDERGQLPSRGLEWRLVQDNGKILLLLRTKEKSLQDQLVRYELQGAETAPVRGFVVLAPVENDWLAAQVAFPRQELHSQLGGTCTALRVGLVAVEQLTGADREALLASLQRSSEEQEQQRLRVILEGLPQ